LLVNLPIVEADYAFDILELLKKIDLTLVPSYCCLVGVFKLYSLQGKELEILCHDSVHG
jgi:hypothetical protein